MRLTLGEIVAALGGDLHGDASVQVAAIQPLESADASGITFLSDHRLLNRLPQCAAACVIVTPEMRDEALKRGACIVTADPYFYYARLTQLWRQRSGNVRAAGIHPAAVVHEAASVHETASIGPLCVVEEGAVIGAHTVLESRVTVAAGCRIGERCIIHPGAVIGADGFGFARHGGQWVKIEQLGAVSIGNDVEIGANTCIDRGALSDTVVEDGAKIDNLVQVAHNTRIGKGTAIAGCTGIAGSAKIGANCTIGGAGMIAGHLTIADDVHVGGGTLISRSIHKPGIYTGVFPFSETARWEKNAAALRHLHDLRERVKVLEKTLQKAP